MTDLKTTQQVFNIVFRDEDGGVLETLASEQAILGLVLDETSARLKVQVVGGVGLSGHKLGSWSGDYAYAPGDIVNYNGFLYKCISFGTGKRPDADTTYWEPYFGALGEKYVRATWYTQISAASGGSGAIGLPPGNASAEFVFNEWPDGIDAVVCGLDDAGRPDERSVYTAGGVRVYVPASGGLSGDGGYSLSGTPAALPCAFVYRYRCKFRDFNSEYALKGCDFEEIPDPAVLKTIRARDGDGVRIEDDGGNGLKILDGGAVEADVISSPGAPPAGKVLYYPKSYSPGRGFMYQCTQDGIEGLSATAITSSLTLTCNPSSGGDFNGDNAIHQALDYLAPYNIAPTGLVTINVDPGVYGASTPLSSLYVTHPNADRILLQGSTAEAAAFPIADAAGAPDTVSGYIYIDNQSGAYSASDFASGGDYDDFVVYVYGSTGNDGVYSVSAAVDDGSDIRLTLNENIHDVTKDGTLYLLAANNHQLHFAPGQAGVQRPQPGVVKVFGLYMKGDTASGWPVGLYADAAGGGFVIYNLIVKDWQAGINLAGNSGVITWGGTVTRPAAIITDCQSYGVTSAGCQYSGKYTMAGNCGIGFDSKGSGSFLNMNAAMASACTTGFFANKGGSIDITNGRIYNNATGCRSESNGTIYRNGMTSVNNTVPYSPAVGGQGADYGVII